MDRARAFLSDPIHSAMYFPVVAGSPSEPTCPVMLVSQKTRLKYPNCTGPNTRAMPILTIKSVAIEAAKSANVQMRFPAIISPVVARLPLGVSDMGGLSGYPVVRVSDTISSRLLHAEISSATLTQAVCP